MKTKIKIETYKDLIEVIKKHGLEDKKIIVGCEGYLSLFDNVYSDTYIKINKDTNDIAITDSCYYDDFE